jgi:hypothetical protein
VELLAGFPDPRLRISKFGKSDAGTTILLAEVL